MLCHIYIGPNPRRYVSQSLLMPYIDNQVQTVNVQASRGGESFLGEGGLLRAIFFFEENFRPTLKRSNPVYATFFLIFEKSKSTGGEQPARIFLNSLVYVCVYVFMYLFIYVFVCVTSPGHTNNGTDLKFGTHTPIDLI